MTNLPQECNILCKCMKEFPSANQIIALAQSCIWLAYCRNVTALQLCISVDQSDPSFAWLVSVCDSARIEDSAQSHQTPSRVFLANITHSVCNTYVGGVTSSYKTDDCSYFHSTNIAVWKSIHPCLFYDWWQAQSGQFWTQKFQIQKRDHS